MAGLARLLHGKHSLQNAKNFNQRGFGQNTQTNNQAISVDCPQLIRHHVAVFVGKTATNTKWIRMTTCCEWCNNECAEMGIQLIW